jgi:pilus assembly protein CpaC
MKWTSELLKSFILFTAAVALIAASPSYAQTKKKKMLTRSSERNAAKQEVLLIKGLQSTHDLQFEPCANIEECIRVANTQLVKVQYSKDKKQIIFTPLARGETTITVRDEKGDIALILKAVVSENNLTRRVLELKELLRDIEGIEIKVMGERIIVDGEVVVIGDLNRLYAVLSDDTYKGIVLNLVTVSPVGMQIMAERMQAEINKPDVKVRPFNGLFLVEGKVDSQDDANTVLSVARSMLQGFTLPTYALDGRSPIDVKKPTVKDPIVARLTIAAAKQKPPEKMLRLTIDFVELSKDYLRNFGFSWIPSLDAGGSLAFGQSTTGGVTSQGSGSLSGTIGNLFPKLNSAQNAGYARILEQSIIITRSGKSGVFQRLLKLPIQVVNAQGGVDFKVADIGPKISVTPRVQGQSDDVELELDFSYDGFAGKQGNAPVTLGHVYKGVVLVRSGESAAVINALSNVISTQFNKDPPGGSVPSNPLFTLLRSKAFQKNKSQFVVFVTPQVMESASTGTDDIKAKYGMKRGRKP